MIVNVHFVFPDDSTDTLYEFDTSEIDPYFFIRMIEKCQLKEFTITTKLKR